MGSESSRSDVSRFFERATFIIFNYDRCVEQFFIHALPLLYAIGKDEAIEIVDKATIIHPYGTIGELSLLKFGEVENNRPDYYALGDRIKTYTERLEEGDTLNRMREEVSAAGRIIFLGFSYLEQNVALLKPTQPIEPKPIFGTGLPHVRERCQHSH